MSRVRIDLSINGEGERHLATIKRSGRITAAAVRRAWFEFAGDLHREANKEILAKNKTGRVYWIRTRGGRRRRHIASAPGQTHANRTGRLRKALSWRVRGVVGLDFGYGIAASSPKYASFVEFGTRKMEARPSIGNAVRAVTSRTVEREYSDSLTRAFGK